MTNVEEACRLLIDLNEQAKRVKRAVRRSLASARPEIAVVREAREALRNLNGDYVLLQAEYARLLRTVSEAPKP